MINILSPLNHDSTANVDVFIKLEPNSIVMIDISQSEILRKQEVSVFSNIDVNHMKEALFCTDEYVLKNIKYPNSNNRGENIFA